MDTKILYFWPYQESDTNLIWARPYVHIRWFYWEIPIHRFYGDHIVHLIHAAL